MTHKIIEGLKEVAALNGWLPIASAPKDETKVLLTDGDDTQPCRWVDGKWETTWDCADFSVGGPPTYWMPMPVPPGVVSRQSQEFNEQRGESFYDQKFFAGAGWRERGTGQYPMTQTQFETLPKPSAATRLREAMNFIRDLSAEGLDDARVGTAAEVALRHINRRAREVLGETEKEGA